MTGLLEIREKLKTLYSKYEVFLLPLVKFLLAFVTLSTLNGKMGYMTKLDNIAIVLIVALMCSFLATGFIVLFAAGFSLMHMYALSMEVAAVGVCAYLILFLLFFRFSPKDAILALVTPLLCAIKIPYVVPLAAGLLCAPTAIVSVGCGLAVHYLLQTVIGAKTAIATMGEEEAVAKLRMILEGFVKNKEMQVMIAAFSVTILTVYLIRRLSIDYAWTIAMIVGAMVNVVLLLIGDLLYEINISVLGVLFGSVLALGVAKALEFFRFCVDYNRTEKVQFEDDEYYYYVKAVPKMSVAAPTKTVKRINAQHMRDGGRSVTMERTTGRRQGAYSASSSAQRTINSGRSVTIGRTGAEKNSKIQDDEFEEFDEY